MFSLPTKLLFALAGFALAVAVAYDLDVSEKAGVTLLGALAVAALLGGLAVRGAGVSDAAPPVPADAPPPERRATSPGPAAWGSLTPLLFAGALGLLAVAAAINKPLVIFAVVLVGVTALAWFGATWAHHSTWTPRVGARVSNRLLIPVVLPIFAFLMAAVIAISISRILLAASEKGSVAVALGVAVVVVTTFFLVASRPRLRASALVALGTVAGLAVVGAGIAGATQGERKFEEKGPREDVLQVAARNTAFSLTELKMTTGRAYAIVFRNHDAVYHNVAIYEDESTRSIPVYNGPGAPGGRNAVYKVDAPAPGTYRFQCDFHANMKGDLVVAG